MPPAKVAYASVLAVDRGLLIGGDSEDSSDGGDGQPSPGTVRGSQPPN